MSSNKTYDVIVFGSCIMDLICYTPKFPNVGETVHGTSFKTGFGGKGANQCIAACFLGSRTAIIAKVGNDAYGSEYKHYLRSKNVFVDSVEVLTAQSTGIAQITVSDTGDNKIIIIPGANDCLSEKDINQDLFDQSKVLLCQLETPLAATIEALQRFQGISIMNAAPGLENIPKELLILSTIFCVNETEASLITKRNINNLIHAKEALVNLLEMGCNTVILTLGKLGAIFATQSEKFQIIHIKAIEVENVIDTTGAGDAFIGALGHFMANYPDMSLLQKIGAACNLATNSVQKKGTQSSFTIFNDTNSDSLALLNENYDWEYL